MQRDLFNEIKELLDKNDVCYEHITHEHIVTSQEGAKIRGLSLQAAAKALIMKASDDLFIQVVVSGAKRANLKSLKKQLKIKNLSLAHPDEVLRVTGCTVGSVPPFGNLFNLPIYFEEGLLKEPYIVFSAGTHTDSIKLHPDDYVCVVKPTVLSFAKEN